MNLMTDPSELQKQATSPARPARKRMALAAAIVAVAAIIAAGVGLWLRSRTAAAPVLVLYGNIDIREIAAAFNDNGPITRMLVQEGDRIKKGQLIAEIDDSRYAAALDQAEGQMRNQEQLLARLVAGSRPEEIAQAKATMEALEVVYQNDEINYRRAEALLHAAAGATRTRDDAKAALDAARQQYEAARQAYILAVKGPRDEDIAAQRAAYEAARGAVALDRRELADTRLYAPADGVIEARILEPGDMASPTTPVYTIAVADPLWVRAYVPEADLGNVKLGMRASIGADSYPGRAYRGWIGYLSPTAEFTPKTIESPELRTRLVYQLRVYVCDPSGDLRLGMPATVSIDLSRTRTTGEQEAGSACGADDAARK